MKDFRLHDDESSPAARLRRRRESRLRDRDSLFPRRNRGRLMDDASDAAEEFIDTEGMGIRPAFRIPIVIMAVIAILAVTAIGYASVSSSELGRAEQSVRSEINYLCLQLKSLGERSAAFGRVVDSLQMPSERERVMNSADYRMLSDPIGNIVSGYTLAETGTVAIIVDDIVIASDDERLPAGANIRELIGKNAYEAISTSIENGKMIEVSLVDALAPVDTQGDADGYLMAGRQGAYTVMITETADMVYRDRQSIMLRVLGVSVFILIVVLVIVDRLLIHLVARHIDKVNETLGYITAGDVDARVEEKGTREFKSLAQGINVTVNALNGWIDEAESRMDAELAAAKAIQESALLRNFPPFPDIEAFDIYASMDPAREVGGDFYDFFLVGDACTPNAGKLGFVVADVSGKGIPAALFMMKAKALIREYVNGDTELGLAVAAANHEICEGNDAGMFVTAWIGVLDYATGHVDYVNAGHNPPLLHRSDGSWQWLREVSGMPLGLFDLEYESLSIECNSNDTLLLYTDGVTEAYDTQGALYGEDRLLSLVKASDATSPQDVQRLVRDDVAAHAEGAEQSDDITILVLQA